MKKQKNPKNNKKKATRPATKTVTAYSYNTKLSVLNKNIGIKPSQSDGDPDMKLGDYFKKIGYPSFAELLKD